VLRRATVASGSSAAATEHRGRPPAVGGGMSRLRPNALARKTLIHGRPFEIFHWKPIHKRHPELTPKETNGATMITLPPSLMGGAAGLCCRCSERPRPDCSGTKMYGVGSPYEDGEGSPPPTCHAKPFGCCEALAAAHGGGAEAAPQIQHTASSGSGPVPHGPAAGAQRPGRRVGGGGGVERGGANPGFYPPPNTTLPGAATLQILRLGIRRFAPFSLCPVAFGAAIWKLETANDQKCFP